MPALCQTQLRSVISITVQGNKARNCPACTLQIIVCYLSISATCIFGHHELARCMALNYAMPCRIHRISDTSSAEGISQLEAPPLGPIIIASLHAVSMPASFPAG